MTDGCMNQLSRPASPPEHAIYTIQKEIARRQRPTPDVHGKRRIVKIRGTGGLPPTIRILGGTLSKSFAQPRPDVGAFFGIVQGSAPVAGEVEKTFKTPSTSIVAARRPEASQAVISSFFTARKVLVPASPFSFETRALRVQQKIQKAVPHKSLHGLSSRSAKTTPPPSPLPLTLDPPRP